MTVGSGIAPDLLTRPNGVEAALAGLPDREPVRLTAGGDFHPALRTFDPP